MVRGDSVETINDQTFEDCTSLSSVEIEESVERIGVQIFSNCTPLTSVLIPESMEMIGDSAFDNCTSLSTVTFEGNPNEIDMGRYVFDETPWGEKNRY